MSLADSVAELEAELDEAQDRIAELEDAERQRAFFNFEAEELECVLEAIADHKRGLITLEELYDRTVGR